MPLSELASVRVSALEPGQRVRMPRVRALQTVLRVTETDEGTTVVDTDAGAYVCDTHGFVDAEINGEVWL